MFSIDNRIALACRWFAGTQGTVANGSGWGWVSDVPPNPQNTAEVICALSQAGMDVPNRPGVEQLVRSHMVDSPRGDWTFREPIDIAWRVRALNALQVGPHDTDVMAGIEALLAKQVQGSGWRMAGTEGPISVTATTCAILALVGSDGEAALAGARTALRALTDGVTSRQQEFGHMYAAALAGYVLALPRARHVLGRHVSRPLRIISDQLMGYLSLRSYEADEESFSRRDLIDTWRHLTLPLALRAIAAARPDAMFEPAFRDGLIALLALQDTTPEHVSYGGFRSSHDGFITSYATTQAVEVLTEIRHSLNERVNPAIAFNLICRREGAHHTDPQRVASVGQHVVLMNSTAALAFMWTSIVAGASLIVSAVLVAERSYVGPGRGLTVLGSVVAGLGISTYVSTRLHRTPRQRVVIIAFTLFTALILPALTFVLQ